MCCVPTVLVVAGVQVRIYLPPREHGPAHVHVVKAGGRVVVSLGDERTAPSVSSVVRMTERDARRAFRIVEAHRDTLLAAWRRYHGD